MKKVVIGMSGGVDSAVGAYLLQKQGYEVIGLFMRNWDSNINNDILGNPNDTNDICPQEKDYNDAKKVCEHLGIEIPSIDFIKEYGDYVFTYFLEELKKGRTPNPDMLCNKYIKFDLFVKEARRLGADFIATGHYARISGNKLLRAKDLNKDQTYFLADVNVNNFKDVLFPVGDYTKDKIRQIAKNANIPVFDKKDSTGICFIGERNFQKFMSNYLKPNPGDIIFFDWKNSRDGVADHVGIVESVSGNNVTYISGNDGNTVKRNTYPVGYDSIYGYGVPAY